MTECFCSDEYGPCELHADTLVVREGASLHTDDELSLLLVHDLVECGVKLSADDTAELARLQAALNAAYDPHAGTAHFSDPHDSSAAHELAVRADQDADGLYVARDGGYVISRPHADCPLLEG